MASSEGLLISPSAATEAEELATPRRMQWEVELARFFNLPRSAPPAGLRCLQKGRRRFNGTWISSKSLATLLVHEPNLHSGPVLSVTVPALACALEEHYVSNLIFSWPQVSCVPQCPVRGSRVVFASYTDSFIQLQKFAMRFSTCSDAESFLDFVKEMVDGAPHECEISSQSEIVASAGLHTSIEEPMPMNDGGIPGSDDNKEPELSQHSMLFSSAPSISSEFPHSFKELLIDCLSDTEKVNDQTDPIGEPDLGFHAQEQLVNPLLQAAPEELESMEEGDITTNIELRSACQMLLFMRFSPSWRRLSMSWTVT